MPAMWPGFASCALLPRCAVIAILLEVSLAAITILGLGPGDAELLTRAAWELLQTTRVLYLRTAIHPTVAALPASIELRSFDALYETAEDFSAIYERIAAEL